MNEVLLDTTLDDTQRRFAEGVQRAGTSLLALINDILDFSKIEAGKIELEVGELELRRLVNDVVGLLADTSAAKGLQLVSQCDADVPSVVRGDAGRVRQILINLVSNAIKFTDHGGVALRVSRPSGGRDVVRVEVADTGIGIAPEDQWRVFQPFSQVDGSQTRRHGGTGLGLAISKAGRGNGQYHLLPQRAGSGTTFWLDVLVDGPPTPFGQDGSGHAVQFYESEAVFCPIDRRGNLRLGHTLTGEAVRQILSRRTLAAGLAAISPHDLRRTYAGDLLDAGADLPAVQQLMGHASPSTTSRYDRRGDRARRSAAERLSLDPGGPAAEEDRDDAPPGREGWRQPLTPHTAGSDRSTATLSRLGDGPSG